MYTEEPAISLFNPAFVARVHAKRREAANSTDGKKLASLAKIQAATAKLDAANAKLEAAYAKAHAEREKLARARKAANDSMRAANAAIRIMKNECSATKREYTAVHPRSMSRILATVSRFTGISQKEILGQHRNRDIVLARQAVMYFCARRTNKSYPQIGRFLGDRDHTTVLHGVSTYVDKRAHKGRNLKRLR
jgi:chromosomal replication initiation ATPase DnaA